MPGRPEPEWGPEPWQPLPPQPPVPVPVPVPVPIDGDKQPPVAEISLWTVVAAVQAVERKVESQALRLLSLEGRAETAEKKLSELEKAVLDFGGQLERKWAALAALVQESTRRLEHVERQLRHRGCWAPRPGLGPGGDVVWLWVASVLHVQPLAVLSTQEMSRLADAEPRGAIHQ
uniref:Uncharacterized protein n=1 Tax=Anser brachyrhynchus TaxID=132585 RepID=A0A8B9BYZ0_9AVES